MVGNAPIFSADGVILTPQLLSVGGNSYSVANISSIAMGRYSDDVRSEFTTSRIRFLLSVIVAVIGLALAAILGAGSNVSGVLVLIGLASGAFAIYEGFSFAIDYLSLRTMRKRGAYLVINVVGVGPQHVNQLPETVLSQLKTAIEGVMNGNKLDRI